jgi:hypothetical protein
MQGFADKFPRTYFALRYPIALTFYTIVDFYSILVKENVRCTFARNSFAVLKPSKNVQENADGYRKEEKPRKKNYANKKSKNRLKKNLCKKNYANKKNPPNHSAKEFVQKRKKRF